MMTSLTRDDAAEREYYEVRIRLVKALRSIGVRAYTRDQAVRDVVETFPGWDVVSVHQRMTEWVRV